MPGRANKDKGHPFNMTLRECEVMAAYCALGTIAETARVYGLSVHTIDTLLTRIRMRMGVENRVQSIVLWTLEMNKPTRRGDRPVNSVFELGTVK